MRTKCHRNSMGAALLLTGLSVLISGCGDPNAGPAGATGAETTDGPPRSGPDTTHPVLHPEPTTETTVEPGTPPLVTQLRRVLAQSEPLTVPTFDELLTMPDTVVVGTVAERGVTEGRRVFDEPDGALLYTTLFIHINVTEVLQDDAEQPLGDVVVASFIIHPEVELADVQEAAQEGQSLVFAGRREPEDLGGFYSPDAQGVTTYSPLVQLLAFERDDAAPALVWQGSDPLLAMPDAPPLDTFAELIDVLRDR